jgi:hypothetical protein
VDASENNPSSPPLDHHLSLQTTTLPCPSPAMTPKVMAAPVRRRSRTSTPSNFQYTDHRPDPPAACCLLHIHCHTQTGGRTALRPYCRLLLKEKEWRHHFLLQSLVCRRCIHNKRDTYSQTHAQQSPCTVPCVAMRTDTEWHRSVPLSYFPVSGGECTLQGLQRENGGAHHFSLPLPFIGNLNNKPTNLGCSQNTHCDDNRC